MDHTAIPRLPIFLNEIVADLRHVVSTVQSAREIGVIKKEQVINIIDSVVQKTAVSSVKDSKGNSLTKFLALLLVLGALIAGYWLLVPGSDNTSGTDDVKPIATPPPTSKRTATAIPTVTKTPAVVIASPVSDKTATNSIGMEFVLIKAGEFKMGSQSDECV
ncbi:MAG TPA: hypothetical protein VMV47_11000 [Bacteroidales bacterium]|nr:hypothetical protein [Bacteroidales bacterium]